MRCLPASSSSPRSFAIAPEHTANMPGGMPFVFSYSCYFMPQVEFLSPFLAYMSKTIPIQGCFQPIPFYSLPL